MKNNNYVKTMMLIIILSLLFIIIRTTYSKYVSSQDNQSTISISKWHISINDQNIIENSDFTETLQVEFDSNANIAQNIIAPTSTGHFDIELDSTGTERSFEYVIKFVDEDSELPDFKIVSYTLNNDSEIEIEEDQTEITGTVDPDVDGMVSGYLVCKYLNYIGKKFQWFVNSDRRHDWSIPTSKLNGTDVIAVDFMIPEDVVKSILNYHKVNS